jgi:uncharacterized coiled-coil DUF342 family protein
MVLEKTRVVVTAVLAGTLIYFATSILLLVKEIAATRTTIAAVSKQAERIESGQNFTGIVAEINRISEQVPAIVAEVESMRKLIPPLLHEIEAIREMTPGVIDEMARVRETVPPILEESAALRRDAPLFMDKTQHVIDSFDDSHQLTAVLAEVEAVRKEIPVIRKELEEIRSMIPPILDEVAAVRETIPAILAESRALREEVPPTLDKAQKLIDDSNELSENMGTGAARGAFKGILTAPVHVLEEGVEDMTPTHKKP